MRAEPVTVRSAVYRWYAVGTWVLLAVLCVPTVAAGGARLAVLPVFAYLAVLAWVVLWRPSLTVDEDGATVVNPWSRARVPFETLIEVSTKWALTLVTPRRRIAVFCAPQPGRFVAARVQRRIRREGDPHERKALERGVHVGMLPGTESGDAAALVQDRWQRALDAGRVEAGAADELDVRVRPDWVAIGIAVLGAAAAIGGAALLAR